MWPFKKKSVRINNNKPLRFRNSSLSVNNSQSALDPFMDPLNPLSPLWIGNSMADSPVQESSSKSYHDSSSSYESSSSYDSSSSSSYDSGSSGGCDGGCSCD